MSEGDDNKVPQQTPASNPGADDPSGGIAAGSGGVSSAAYVNSPVPNEQKSVVQSTVDTVKSYLPSLAGLSLTGSKTEEPEAKDAGGDEAGSKDAATTAGVHVAAAASTAAVAVGLKRDGDAPTDSADPATSSNSKDEAIADSSPKDGAKTDTATLVSKAKDADKSADLAPTDREKEESMAKTDTEGAQPGEGGGGSEETRGGNEPQKAPTKKENLDAIPTAGGERLGDKHWGESKIVPDVPKQQPESAQVASEEGQPDKTTQDNTAQNTGGAAPPASTSTPSSSSPAPASAEKGKGEKEKQSFKDKMKSKLNIGSKKT